MQLIFKNNMLGYINNISRENSWIYGSFEATDKFVNFQEFFRAIVSEEGFDENKFDCELLLDINWMVSDNGVLQEIEIPAIYDDGDIAFRYR